MTPFLAETAGPRNALAHEIFEDAGDVKGEVPFDVAGHGLQEAGLQTRAVGLHEAKPEAQEGIGDAVGRALATPGLRAEGLVAAHEAEVEEPAQRPTERGRGLAQSAGDLREAMASRSDEGEERAGLRHLANIVEQQRSRLVVEHAQRGKRKLANRRSEIPAVGRQLPVPRDAAPDRIGLDGSSVVRRPQRSLDPARVQGTDAQDLGRAPEEGRGAVEDEALHRPLRRAGQDEVSSSRSAVEKLLQEARDLRGRGDESRQLVQGEDQAGPGGAEEPGQERLPVRVG